jgi:hypothetical protein
VPLADVVPEQRMASLQKANRIRANRANLKRDLFDGSESIDNLLWEPPDYIHTMGIGDLIRAVPGYGKVRTDQVLKHCHVSESRTVGHLTVRQRAEIRDTLGSASWS